MHLAGLAAPPNCEPYWVRARPACLGIRAATRTMRVRRFSLVAYEKEDEVSADAHGQTVRHRCLRGT